MLSELQMRNSVFLGERHFILAFIWEFKWIAVAMQMGGRLKLRCHKMLDEDVFVPP